MSEPNRLFPPSDASKVEHRRSFLINLLYFGIIGLLVFLVFRYLALWMLPFVFAFIVAALLQKPLRWLVKVNNGGKKFFSVVLVVVCILILAGLILLLGWRVVVGVSNFVSDESNIQMIQDTVMNATGSIQNMISTLSDALSEEAVESLTAGIETISDNFLSVLTSMFTGAASWLLTFTTQRLPMILVSFIIWIVASIFCTIDYERVTGFFLRQVPDRHKELVNTTRELFTGTVFKMLKAYMLLMFITFVELSIGFMVLKVSYAIPLAALIALVDILPILGTGTVLIPWALISLIMGDYKLFIGLGIIYIIITVIRNIIEPRLVSQQIGLNPLVTLFFMYLGLRAIGLAGMLLFPMCVMVLKQLHDSGRIHIWN